MYIFIKYVLTIYVFYSIILTGGDENDVQGSGNDTKK